MTADLKTAGLQDIPRSAIQEQLRDIRARNSATCDVEYGIRSDDNALVFHFFPPGYALDSGKDWADWTAFRDKLEKALLAHFAKPSIDAGYAQELRSFHAIIKPRPLVPDLTALLEDFFEQLEA